MMTSVETWLQRLTPHPSGTGLLVCFPHAGGSAAFFRDWGLQIPGAEVCSVRYPGRAERIDEEPYSDLRELGRDIATAIEVLADREVFLFGHSLGAAVALETARTLEGRGVQTAHLFASGSMNAPCPDDSNSNEDDDAETVQQLIELGGTDPELAAEPEFQELVLPYIRADSRMFHGYVHSNEPTLRCPVTTIVGDADEEADRRPWSELTSGGFREVVVPGDHFYLAARPPYALLHNLLATASSTHSVP